MYLTNTVPLQEPPLAFWHRIVADDAAALRTLALRLVREGGSLRTLLGFQQPTERRGPVSFGCEIRPHSGPGGALFVSWDARLTSLEGEVEIVPDGAGHLLRMSASYEPPWSATLVADRRSLRRLGDTAILEFLRRLTEPVAVPDGPRQHILIEDEDAAWHRAIASLAGADECEFDSCGGPAVVPGGCPVLREEPCPKVEWADVILHSLDGRQAANAALYEALTRGLPDGSVTTLGGEPATRCIARHHAAHLS